MSNNEVTRNKLSFEKRAKYFKKRVGEFFTSYKNESGGEDCIEVCLIREGRRAVIMAEEEINRQKADNVKLKEESEEKCKQLAERIKLEFYYEFDELIPSIMADKIDNILNELIGE